MSILIPYVDYEQPDDSVNEANVVVVWDLDETLAHNDPHAGCVLYRDDLIRTIFGLKELSIKNVLWTRGNLAHLIDVIGGTWLSWCFDEYLWDEHSDACLELFGKHKHPSYLMARFPNSKFILIDNEAENCREWPMFICATELKSQTPPDTATTTAIGVLVRVAGLCAQSRLSRTG